MCVSIERNWRRLVNYYCRCCCCCHWLSTNCGTVHHCYTLSASFFFYCNGNKWKLNWSNNSLTKWIECVWVKVMRINLNEQITTGGVSGMHRIRVIILCNAIDLFLFCSVCAHSLLFDKLRQEWIAHVRFKFREKARGREREKNAEINKKSLI